MGGKRSDDGGMNEEREEKKGMREEIEKG